MHAVRTVTALAVGALVASGLVLGTPPATAANPGKPKLTTHFCWGAEDAPEGSDLRVRPPAIVLECEAYSPQHGYTNSAWITDITWTEFGGRTATGTGNLQYLWCPDGGELVGTTVCAAAQASIPARITLSGSAKDGKRKTLRRYTTVTVAVDGLPDMAGPQVLTWKPPKDAYT